MIPVSILGGSGYTGVELMRIIAGHPDLTLSAVSSRQYEGQPVSSVFGALTGRGDLTFSAPSPEIMTREARLVFLAVPHRAAMAVVPELLAAGVKVVDLSADFRLRDRAVYEEWYAPHTAPELLSEAAYGLTEFYRQDVKAARLTANPGCYVTSVLAPLIPCLLYTSPSPRD